MKVRVERQKTTAQVLTRCQELEELDDGYALKFPTTAPWPEKLDSFRTSWSRSCPHMSFEVVPDGDVDAQWLHIRGPEGTKQFVEGARYMLTSHINPAPSLGYKLRHGLRYLTSPLRALPGFLIIGAKKCGTTALYSYLTQHPEVTPAYRKEIYYFNAYWRMGRAWYKSFFPTRATGGLSGEATPDYLFHPRVPKRVAETVPNARLIAILRNPIDRAYSFYNHNLRAGLEDLSFEDAIDREEERLEGELERILADPTYVSFEYMQYSYLLRGHYAEQLEAWRPHFAEDQFLVLGTEALYDEGEATLRRAFDFLGLAYHAPEQFKKLNAAPGYPEMDPRTRERLVEYYAPHNARLYELTGTDFDW